MHSPQFLSWIVVVSHWWYILEHSIKHQITWSNEFFYDTKIRFYCFNESKRAAWRKLLIYYVVKNRMKPYTTYAKLSQLSITLYSRLCFFFCKRKEVIYPEKSSICLISIVKWWTHKLSFTGMHKKTSSNLTCKVCIQRKRRDTAPKQIEHFKFVDVVISFRTA